MERKRLLIWTVKWCSFFASVACLAVTETGADDPRPATGAGRPPPPAPASDCRPGKDRFLMVVSTMDGKVSALNVNSGGEEWSIDTGRGSLLSSSIGKLEVSENGVTKHLIPSLEGGLYQFDGETIKPVPLAADVLLSNSFRFKDNSMVVGGKEIETYGIDMTTGKVRYVCSVGGCQFFDHNATLEDDADVLVITRNTKTVRAVAMQNGLEKWNFSVGQHELTYSSHAHDAKDKTKSISSSGNSQQQQQQQHLQQEDESEDFVYQQHCNNFEDEDGGIFDMPWFSTAPGEEGHDDVDLKVIVPTGVVAAISKSDPGHVLWQYKFPSPIANAWILKDGDLSEVSLFDDRNVPALSTDYEDVIEEVEEDGGPLIDPLLYIGLYEGQLYVQPSVHFQQQVQDATTRAMEAGNKLATVDMPQVRWRPYLATAPSRTPIMYEEVMGRRRGRPLIGWKKGEEQKEETGLTVWQMEDYPYDGGYFLFADNCAPIDLETGHMSDNSSGLKKNGATLDSDFTGSLRYWLREVAVICVFTSILMHFLILKLCYTNNCSDTSIQHTQENSSHSAETDRTKTDSTEANGDSKNVGKADAGTEYVSRYCTDFEQLACLGKGGFGVVFKSKNQLDDCQYAIKRITLNNSDKAKEKVMREVKALAKLNHCGIVRYHQAWFENPPPGWQEERDKNNVDMSSISPESPGYSITEYSPGPVSNVGLSPSKSAPVMNSSEKVKRTRKSSKKASTERASRNTKRKTDQFNPLRPNGFNPLQPFGGMSFSDQQPSGEHSDFTAESTVEDQSRRAGSSEGFVPANVRLQGTDSESCDDSSRCRSINMHSNPSHHSLLNGIIRHGYNDSDDDDGDDSVDISFRNTDSANGLSESGINESMPFLRYDTHPTVGVDGEDIIRGCDTDSSVDVVFEDSGCADKSLNEDLIWDSKDHAIIDVAYNSQSETKDQGQSSSSLTSSASKQNQSSKCLDSDSAQRTSADAAMKGRSGEGTDTISELPAKVSSSPPRPNHLELRQKTVDAKKSPNAPKLYLFIQMEMCKAESLKDWLNANTLSRDKRTSLDIFHQITTAVQFVHDMGMMHRDLKPSNIFFAMDGTVKIGDFGLVTALEESGDGSAGGGPYTPMYNNQHTDQVGTRLYMSPEQNAGKNYTHAVDIYALGLIFFELFYPFATQMERIRTLLEVKRLLFPARFQRELPEEYEFVKPLLLHEPEKRPSAGNILERPLLGEFEDARRVQLHSRARSLQRLRTFSVSSSHSASGSAS